MCSFSVAALQWEYMYLHVCLPVDCHANFSTNGGISAIRAGRSTAVNTHASEVHPHPSLLLHTDQPPAVAIVVAAVVVVVAVR